MKNAEKYAKQIAEILADSAICPVTNCALEGVCANAEKLKEWLLQEASS